MDEMIAFYVRQLHHNDYEDAYHYLIEIDESLIPDLMDAYTMTRDEKVRSIIIDIIGEHRRASDINFVAATLKSESEQIGKSSLDALVKMGAKRCIDVLISEKAKAKTTDQECLDWYDEAIQQLEQRRSE
ncbi:MAG: HEAT repeat domain-containing protein [Anaerolineaceae bacterium]|nr:HEAT repeat domain-containing protein [Anaerolineae bacterium]MCB9455907.1 HEAT repeat domain-containing protein [Anaerolineaceae bacterium]